MNLEEFRDSLAHEHPPEELSLALAGLWWDAKGAWTKAHDSAQQDEGPVGCLGTCLSSPQGRRLI